MPLYLPITIEARDRDLQVNVLDTSLADVTVEWGDGSSDQGGSQFTHSYDATTLYDLEVTGSLDGQPYSLTGQVVTLQDEYRTGFSGEIVEPDGAGLVEGVMPGLVFGNTDASATVALGFAVDASNAVSLDLWQPLATIDSTNLIEAAPARVVVPVVNKSDGSVSASLVIEDAVLVLPDAAGPATMTGSMSTAAVVDAVVAVGGFDAEGALAIVASILGYTPETLPEWVDFLVVYPLEAF